MDGSDGPYLMTLQLSENGGGKLCNSYGASNYLQVVKYSSGMVYIQDGTRMSVVLNGDTLTAKFPYTGSKPADFQRDSDLAMAAPYCRQNL
ncbi:J517_1871 family lipoprotein [Halopseudomonas litoralis]|uniref:J517_1871 family lipoprotein n=1 Tax=Halopseudomonas litoralis TaxID=797277 RepID=UPI002F3FD47D